jgi:hypothetical protein
MNHRYFETRGMRPLFFEEIAVHPSHHGMGIGLGGLPASTRF